MPNNDPTPPGQGASKIQHSQPGFVQDSGAPGTPPAAPQHHVPGAAPTPAPPKRPISTEPEPVPMVESSGISAGPKTITAFGKMDQHEEKWNRKPNANGTGAIHVKTFHAKLTADALDYMDQMVNDWLDAHPEYEVKFVHSTVGILTGKLKEPHLICQVWV